MVTVIRRCLFCPLPADVCIPVGFVCRTHAIEFFNGLIAHAIERPAARELGSVPRFSPSDHVPAPRPARADVKRLVKAA